MDYISKKSLCYDFGIKKPTAWRMTWLEFEAKYMGWVMVAILVLAVFIQN